MDDLPAPLVNPLCAVDETGHTQCRRSEEANAWLQNRHPLKLTTMGMHEGCTTELDIHSGVLFLPPSDN